MADATPGEGAYPPPANVDMPVPKCGHAIHVLYRTSPDTAARIGVGIDEIGPLQFDVYGRECGVNGDPVDAEMSRD